MSRAQHVYGRMSEALSDLTDAMEHEVGWRRDNIEFAIGHLRTSMRMVRAVAEYHRVKDEKEKS